MSLEGFGARIKTARNECGFTQKQLANKLGVTEQAVSKWERENSYPDTIMLDGISKILDCSLDYLFQFEKGKKEFGAQDSIEKRIKIKNLLIPDVVTISMGEGLINVFMEEMKNNFMNIDLLRQQIAACWGIILPTIRIVDEMNLEPRQYVFKIHGVEVYSEKDAEQKDNTELLIEILEKLKGKIFEHINIIVNNQMIYEMVEAIRDRNLATIDYVVPDKINYSMLREVVIELLAKYTYTVNPLILIIQAIEKYLDEKIENVSLCKYITEYLGEGYLLKNWVVSLR